MIVTLTPNPSLDRTVEVDELRRGTVTRVRAAALEAAGKGVNVARALTLNDHKALSVLPVGGPEGAQLTELLRAGGVEAVLVPIAGAVRSNVTLVETDGTTTKLNEIGPELSAPEAAALLAATVEAAAGADWLVLCGSLPPGVPDRFYADLIAALSGRGVRIALDTSGPALALGISAGPDLVKPNREELAEVTGSPVRELGDAVTAAERLRELGARAVLVSLGADGALLVDDSGVHHGLAPARPVSTVGAGDALLAGFLAGGGSGAAALAEALAWGAAAVTLPGSRMPGPADLNRSAITIAQWWDPRRPLHV